MTRDRAGAAISSDSAAVIAQLEQLGTNMSVALRGLQMNGVIYSQLLTLDVNGKCELHSQVPVVSLVVANLGTAEVIVNGTGGQSSPARSGPGTAVVPAGSQMILYMASTDHAFYGRAGEQVLVTGLSRYAAPAAELLFAAPWFVTNPQNFLGVWVSGVAYTQPWGMRAIYGGLQIREVVGVAGSLNIRDANATGMLLDTVTIAANTSMEIEMSNGRPAPSGVIYVEVLGGLSVTGTLAVR